MTEHGSYTGFLRLVGAEYFIFPTSHLPIVKCIALGITPDMADKYVTVYGIIDYLPNFIVVDSIDIHPDDGDLPKLSDLCGIWSNYPSDISSEKFIRGLRNQEEE